MEFTWSRFDEQALESFREFHHNLAALLGTTVPQTNDEDLLGRVEAFMAERDELQGVVSLCCLVTDSASLGELRQAMKDSVPKWEALTAERDAALARAETAESA